MNNPKDWFVAEYTRRWEADQAAERREDKNARLLLRLCGVTMVLWVIGMGAIIRKLLKLI